MKGSVRIYKTSYDGKESTIKIIHTGEIFAEAILFGKKQYPATAAAVEESEIVAIHCDSFWKMMDSPKSKDNFSICRIRKVKISDRPDSLSVLV